MSVTREQIQHVLRTNGLSARPLCVHASVRSFGHITGGPAAIVDACLDEGCTVMVPAFSDTFAVPPPADQRPPRNGWSYATFAGPTTGAGRVYRPDSNEVDREMGAVAAEVVKHPARVRGEHPLNSFAAVGPLARLLIAEQSPTRVYAPIEALVRLNGLVVLMGVGLESATLLHLAEQQAGRTLFRRWANDPTGIAVSVAVGGCSDGFPKLEPSLARLISYLRVGDSQWRVFAAGAVLDAGASVIRQNPAITHCGKRECDRCTDAIAGGPILS